MTTQVERVHVVSARRRHRVPRPQQLWPYALVLPALVALGVFTYVPLIKSIVLSVTDSSLLRPTSGNYVGLTNYTSVLTSASFWQVFAQTLLWTGASVIGAVIVGVGAALLLHGPRRGRGLFRGWLLLPWIAPPVTSAYMWQYLYHDSGPLPAIVQGVGWTPQPIDFLNDVQISFLGASLPLWSVIQVGIWAGFPFIFLFALAALSAVSQELRDAAAIDGASNLRVFWHITLPLIAPLVETSAILLALFRLGGVDLPFLLTEGGPDNASNVLGVLIYNTAFQTFLEGQAAALGVILFILTLPLSVMYVRRATRQIFG
jgi:multiple sugar transport system permease protein